MDAVLISVPLKKREVIKSRHSQVRMSQRGIRKDAINTVLKFGRIIRGKRGRRFFLGRKEVKQWAEKGIRLEAYVNLHVVMDVQETKILTVYRNAKTRSLGYSKTATQ